MQELIWRRPAADRPDAIDFLHDEVCEEGEQELSPRCIRCLVEQGDRVLQHLGVGQDRLRGLLDPPRRVRETLLDDLPLQGHLLEARLDESRRQASVGEAVDQAFFGSLELVQLSAEVLLELAVGCLQVTDGFDDIAAKLRQSGGRDLLARHCVSNRVIDLVDPQVARCALVSQVRGAHVVLVATAVAVILAVDEATLATVLRALGALQEAAQVMKVDAVAVALTISRVEDLVHSEEQLFGDERLVPSWVERTLVADDAGVIGVVKDDGQLRLRDWTLGGARRRSHQESALFEHVLQLSDRALPSRVLLEGPLDQGGAFWVEVDRVDEPATELFSDVEVAHLRPSNRSSLLDLVGHLEGDVFAVLLRLPLIEQVGHRLHDEPVSAAAEALFSRDDLDPPLGKRRLDDCALGDVSEHAGALVCDDVSHFGVLLNEPEHLLEDGPLGDRASAGTRFDELSEHPGAKVRRLLVSVISLRCDRVAVLIDVGARVSLAGR